MLFSLPNRLDRNFGYMLLGITCCLHVMLLAIFFTLEGYFSQEKPLIFDLKNMGSRVSMLSGKRPQGPARKQPVKKKPPVKKAPVKKTVAAKKAPAKPVAAKKPVSKVQPKKSASQKTIPVKKKVESTQEKKSSDKKNVAEKSVKATAESSEPIAKEFNVADAAGSSDKVIREIYHHLTIPPGIDDAEVFTIMFDVDDKGKVVNIRARGSEPLVIYTAFKDALLHSTMPIKNRKNIPLVIK